MYHLRTIFLLALGASLVLWVATWWRTPPQRTWQYQGSGHLIAFGADGQLLLTEQHGVATTRSPDPQAYMLVVSPDGHRLATGGQGVVRVWDASSGQLIHTFTLNRTDAVTSMVSSVDLLAFSPDGQILAISAGDREKTYLWQVADGHSVATIPQRSASVGFSPDGQEITLGGDPVQVFRVRDGRAVRQFPAAGHVTLSPDGRLLAVSKADSAAGLRIFRYADGALLQSFGGAHGYTYLAAFSPDSHYLATMYVPGGSASNLGVGAISLSLFSFRVPITLWRTSDWRGVQTFSGHPNGAYVLAYSPAGDHLVSIGSDKSIQLWPVAPHAAWWYWLGPLSVLVVLVAALAWRVWGRA